MDRRIRPWMVVVLIGLVYVGLTLARHKGDPLAFALVGTQYSQGDPDGTQGYDGQFAYFIARDPLGGCQRCDRPAYRYQRILYPLVAWGLALGQPQVIPWSLIVVNLGALAMGTYFTERLLVSHRVSPWYALAYGLYGGLIAGLRLDLAEPLAYSLLQGGMWAWADDRTNLATPLLALAALSKETTLVAVAGLLIYLLYEKRWRDTLSVGLGVAVPFALWQAALWIWLGEPGVGSGGAMATPFEWFPFAGLLRIVTVSWPAFLLLLAIEGPLFVVPTVWALTRSVQDHLDRRPHPWTSLLLAQAAVLPFLPFSTWREPLAIARLASGLVAATLLYGAAHRSQRVLNLTFAWLATLALLINESQLPV